MTKVLVLLPMRNLSSRVRRVLGSRLDEPKGWTKVPIPGGQMPTTAPGTGELPPKAPSSLFTAAEMANCVAGLNDWVAALFAEILLAEPAECWDAAAVEISSAARIPAAARVLRFITASRTGKSRTYAAGCIAWAGEAGSEIRESAGKGLRNGRRGERARGRGRRRRAELAGTPRGW